MDRTFTEEKSVCSTPECKQWQQVMPGLKVIHIAITEIQAHVPGAIHKNEQVQQYHNLVSSILGTFS